MKLRLFYAVNGDTFCDPSVITVAKDDRRMCVGGFVGVSLSTFLLQSWWPIIKTIQRYIDEKRV